MIYLLQKYTYGENDKNTIGYFHSKEKISEIINRFSDLKNKLYQLHTIREKIKRKYPAYVDYPGVIANHDNLLKSYKTTKYPDHEIYDELKEYLNKKEVCDKEQKCLLNIQNKMINQELEKENLILSKEDLELISILNMDPKTDWWVWNYIALEIEESKCLEEEQNENNI